MAGGYQRYSDFNWTCKYRLFSSDEAVNLVCGSVLGDTAAVGLSGGDMVPLRGREPRQAGLGMPGTGAERCTP